MAARAAVGSPWGWNVPHPDHQRPHLGRVVPAPAGWLPPGDPGERCQVSVVRLLEHASEMTSQ